MIECEGKCCAETPYVNNPVTHAEVAFSAMVAISAATVAAAIVFRRKVVRVASDN